PDAGIGKEAERVAQAVRHQRQADGGAQQRLAPGRQRGVEVAGSRHHERRHDRPLQPDLAEIDAGAELGLDGPAAAARRDLHHIAPRILLQPVETEVAVIVANGLAHDAAVLGQTHARTLDALDDAVHVARYRAADKAFRVAPQVAVVDARPGAELGLEHFEPVLPRHPRHLVILDLDGAHGSGRTGLVPTRLVP